MKDIKFILPFPPSKLSPNGRTHYMAKAKIAADYKRLCKEYAKAVDISGCEFEDGENIAVSIIFHEPDRRMRDLDNMLSSCKAGIDAICEVIGVNDKLLRPIRITDAGSPAKKDARVEITLHIGDSEP